MSILLIQTNQPILLGREAYIRSLRIWPINRLIQSWCHKILLAWRNFSGASTIQVYNYHIIQYTSNARQIQIWTPFLVQALHFSVPDNKRIKEKSCRKWVPRYIKLWKVQLQQNHSLTSTSTPAGSWSCISESIVWAVGYMISISRWCVRISKWNRESLCTWGELSTQ